jgi:transposase
VFAQKSWARRGGQRNNETKSEISLQTTKIQAWLTLAELARKYDSRPTQIAGWKRQAKEGMVAAFSGQKAHMQKDAAAEIRELHAKIGQLAGGGRRTDRGKVERQGLRPSEGERLDFWG